MRETKLPMQELEPKCRGGGLMREGGRNRGILWYIYCDIGHRHHNSYNIVIIDISNLILV